MSGHRKPGRPGARKSGSGARNLQTRVKTARGRKASSTRWLKRQLNDPYVAQAQAEGLRSRAAFKLIELDERFRLLRRGARVVDLGAAPGSWSQVAVARVGSQQGAGWVLAVDKLEFDPVPGADTLLLDLADAAAVTTLLAAAGGPVDVVLSDMAPATSGHQSTDHLRIVALAETAWEVAEGILGPGGSFLAKVFAGGSEAELLALLKRSFDKVRHVKPQASRRESAEVYVVATGFRGSATSGDT
ncbi:MAG: RlmE family RNA methyltransferase [Alphaproteobacteria bacterium]|nr:rRNA methyltransferase [Rhodospirillaceae bacterium]MDP6404896.1 RlmE family RNA methyltransferase [Alphaproteobacteria bacterium]MDP7605012.1 RlmE family RNA methyltransferase [Alphaproteobacteria bacterium]HJP21464.1 RlmE family RNA methyltransferase [Alphaproteobacteria bacterium]